ncbi:MAG: ABC transporter ATP-binding protein [Lachnospiraceae bacterium]|jgi:ATP-binding cassette subfamily F protein 3|nr:MAG: ABC transporter ATP-binding protein [Lachnospiraceae bacterium]
MRYQIRHALVQYGAETIIEDVNFDIHDHEKIAIVGRNGCGKTTLLKLIAGDITMANIDSDESCGIAMAGNQKIGYLRQISFEDQEISVENEILKVFEPVFACERRMKELTDIMETDHDQKWMYEYSSLQDQMEAMGGYTYRRDMETMFQKFGFDLKDITRPIGTFSGGQQTKVAFIKLLLSRPDIMLLDEPTNHLDLPTIEWLEGYLKNYNKAVVIVSHDRMFLDRIIDVTYEIEYHRIKRYPGNYTTFMKLKEEAALKQEKDYEEQQKEIKRLTEWIEKWKNTPTKVASVHSKEKQLEHMVLIEKPRRFDTKAFRGQFLPRTTSYTDVLTLKALEIGYDHVLSKVSFTLKKGERVAIIGENGKGKSTLLKTLMGQIPPLGGSYTVGTGVEVGYFDQQAAVAESMYPDKTVLNDFWDMYPTLKEVEVRNALGSFLFTGEEVFKTLGQLSGGEKVRLALCKMFKMRPNLLILDEPTNHMDLIGKEALENMLKNYTGTILFVSHDRYFIKEIATGMLDFKQDKTVFYDCGYEEYLERLQKEELKQQQLLQARQEEERKEKKPEGSGNKTPTLSDVFDKKTYYNPGKILSRLKQQMAKYEKQLEESEQRLADLQMQIMDPALASDYTKLMELEEQRQKEEQNQESLLERMLETETELEEMQQQ